MAITLDGTNGILSPDFEPSGSTTPTNGLFLPTTNSLGFATNSTERLRLDASGNLLVGLTSATSGGGVLQVSNGITFPATQSASSNANTLDDYEEGTWTATASSESNCSGTSMAVGSSWYVKVGGLVSYAFRLTTTISSANTKLSFAYTLPFTQSSTADSQGGSALVEGPSPYPYAAANIVDASGGSHLAYLAVGAAALNFSGSATIYVTGQFKAS